MGLLVYQTWSYNKICIYLEWQLLNFDEVVDITKHTNKCLKKCSNMFRFYWENIDINYLISVIR